MTLKQKLAVLGVLVLVGPACHKDPPPPTPSFPKASPTPVVVPSNPTPAPTPREVAVPSIDEGTRLRQMPIDELDRMGLLGDVFFDFNEAELREADRASLVKNG